VAAGCNTSEEAKWISVLQNVTAIEAFVTLAVTLRRRSYGKMLDRKAEPGETDRSQGESDQEHL